MTAPGPGRVKTGHSRPGRASSKSGHVLAAGHETTLNALAVEAFNDLLRRHGKRASVENPLLD
jgi:hypothetical protein